MDAVARPAGPEPAAAARPSAWAPFRSRVFVVLWTAVLLGNIGTWMRDVGAGWLMTSLSASATAVALVQVATTLPIFLLSLPAGVLADLVNRRRLVLGINVGLALVVLALALATQSGWITAPWLIAALALAGIGTALLQPVMQSLTPLTVPRADLGAAVALNSLGFNVARAIGPALGGALIAGLGVAVTFWLDALSYLFVIAAFWWWKGAAVPASSGPAEHFGSALLTGLRYARHAPALQRVMLRACSFFVFASAYWALLPLVARERLGGGPGYYGLLMASIGAGAVIAALALPALRRKASAQRIMALGLAATVLVLVVLAASRNQVVAALALLLAGAAWIAVLTTANVAAQSHLPNWVRGRGLALYLTVFYGAMAAGSLVWGALADAWSITASLAMAAGVGVLSLLLGWWKPMPEDAPDLSPSQHWKAPEQRLDRMNERGPVLVTVEYTIAPKDEAAFLEAIRALSQERLRDGAHEWGVFEDLARPGCFLETFIVASWAEHERQHRRVSVADELLQQRLRRLHQGPGEPVVTHLLAPAWRRSADHPPARPEGG